MSTFVQQEINERNRWVYFSKKRWIAHVAYWAWVLIVGTIWRLKGPITPSVVLNHFILANLHIAFFFYLYCLYLIPYFFKRNKNLHFWVLVLLSFLLISASDVYFNQYFVHLTEDPNMDPSTSFWTYYPNRLIGYFINFLLFSMTLFFMEKNEENDLVLEMEKEKKEIEMVKLDLLKTNISPDFMMRSLNQLKRAALVPEPYTPESIIKFSELLRYRLYRGKNLESPLNEELQALNDFISFIGYDQDSNNLFVRLHVNGFAEDKSIAALALINLVEPFCKIRPEQPVTLNLDIDIFDDRLQLKILYSTKANDGLFDDLNKYGEDYKQLYGGSVLFNFENCMDETCKIQMTLPLMVKA